MCAVSCFRACFSGVCPYYSRGGMILCYFPSSHFLSPHRPRCPFASAHHIIRCRLHVLFMISLASFQCCRRSASACPFCGAYVDRACIGIFDLARSSVTRSTLMDPVICVMYCCVISCIVIAVPPCTTPAVALFLSAVVMIL